MIRLLVARHGQTDANRDGIYTGTLDVPLNQEGLRQAEALHHHPLLNQAQVLVSSPLLRALQTAQVLQRRLGLPLQQIPEFAERCVGVYQGLTRAQVQARYPELWARLGVRRANEAPTGGETLLQFTARVEQGLEILRQQHDGKCVLLVAHAFVAREINRGLRGLPYEEMDGFTLGNGELAEFWVGE